MDIQLTDRGRQLLAQGQLNFAYYAFSDDFIDYSGSLNQALNGTPTGTLDDVVRRNYVPVEANQMEAGGAAMDLRYFLFTAPEQRKSLPTFQVNVPLSVSLVRMYQNKDLGQFLNHEMNNKNAFDFVISTTMDNASPTDRNDQYLAEQNLEKIEQEDPGLISVGFKTQ